MFYHNINPVLAQLGPFTVRYYGLIFALGILVSFFLLRHLAARRKLPLSRKDFDDLLIFGMIGVIIGARLGHVISAGSYYFHNPMLILTVWNGGLAFHGGFIGLVAVGVWFARRKKISFYDIADIAVIPAALALALGRIANFINGEFYGTPTGLPWGVKFTNVEGFRHPVQLYEALKNFAIFAVLWQLRDRKLPRGFLFWLFVFLYGSVRFPLEFYKDVPQLAFGLTWGQVWCIPMVIAGGYALLRLRRAGT